MALRAIQRWKPDQVVFIGDFGDCYSISEFDKDPERKVSFLDEVEAVNRELDQVQNLVDANAVFIEGNHEDRGRRKVWRQVPELAGLVSIPRLYRLRERGWKHVPYRGVHRIGNVAYTHDIGRAGVNTARQTVVDFGGNIVVGHSHRGGVYYQGEAKGSAHFCLNVGWLGDVKKVDYMHQAKALRDWQLGFGTVIHDGAKAAFARFHPVVRGAVEVDGVILDSPLR